MLLRIYSLTHSVTLLYKCSALFEDHNTTSELHNVTADIYFTLLVFVVKCLCDTDCCAAVERPVHCLENVTDILKRWSYWPDEFCQNNYLVMKPYSLVQDMFETTVSCHFVNISQLRPVAHHSKVSLHWVVMLWFWYLFWM